MISNSYQTYPTYKDSGVEWVGDIPSEWQVLPFFVHASQCKRSNKGMVNDNLLSLSYGRVIRKSIETAEGLLPASFETYQIIEPNEIVFRLTDLQNDKRSLRSALCRERGIITSAYLVVKPVDIHPSYLAYLMRSYDLTKVLYSLGSGLRQSLKYSDMKRLPLLIPSREEQTQIARFLDYETAKIDALIEKQQQLIALLKEKRQAVISHAVTKGLNPDAPMRDSGIEWLGEIPAHWTATRLKYHVRQIVDGSHVTPTYVDDGVPFLRVTDIQTFPIDPLTIKYIPETEHQELVKRCRPEPGDLLLSKNGSIGIPRIVDWDWEFSIFVSLCLIKTKKSLDVRFLYYFFLTHQISEQIFGLVKQSTVINLHLDKIANFWIAIPNHDEQAEIVGYLDKITKKYDVQIENAEKMNRLLQERRTALISAAVTGKIDVRGWQPPHSQPEKAEKEAA